MSKYSIKTATNRAARVLRSAKKTNGSGYALQYAYTDANGRQTVTDTFRLYRFKTALADLPAMPSDERFIDVQKLFARSTPAERAVLYAPEIEPLKAIIKARKEKHEGLVYSFGDGFPCVNAVYLLELLETFPDAVLYTQRGSLIKPIYAVSEHGEALLCPMRGGIGSFTISAEQAEAPAEDAAEQQTGEPDAAPETLTPDEFAERFAVPAPAEIAGTPEPITPAAFAATFAA